MLNHRPAEAGGRLLLEHAESSASDSIGCKQGAFGLLVCPMRRKAHLEQTEGRYRESALTLIHPLKTESPLVRQTT